ncbi:protein tramtrack, beta isoform isoform X4 [Amyelois transitella]|uniref:protein tramtrack, beta isoform isoform X4 n=1 Tax=Amyelois transitella TaxID=680683 RepID=UPI0029905F87|nr:protein tramtrack, beta isoform isoform X4 [Amyelois transitella]
MASDEQFSLCWNNFHANMSAGFHGLLSRGDLVDVTLAAEGRLLQAHKLVLSVCSPYFQEMFKMNPTQHPIVFLKDVSHSALRDLLQFMYQGEVNVKQEELASFISTAEQLQVKGLTGNQNEDSSTPSKPKPTSRPGPRSSQQRQSVMKLETDLDSKPSSTPVAIKRPNRPSIASNNSSSSQSGPAKRKCVDPLEAGPSGSAKEEFVTIPDEDENNAVAPKMEPEFVNESMWDDDEDGANNDETNFGEDDSNMEMTGFDGSATGDGNMSGGGEGGAVGDAQDSPVTTETFWSEDETSTITDKKASPRKRLRTCKDEIRKRNANRGLPYVSRNGKVRSQRLLKPPCPATCRRKCYKKISEEDRLKIFKKFWDIGDHSRQWIFLTKYASKHTKKRITIYNVNSTRQSTISYTLPIYESDNSVIRKIPVCQTMFLNTFSISFVFMKFALLKLENGQGAVLSDQRGKHPKK